MFRVDKYIYTFQSVVPHVFDVDPYPTLILCFMLDPIPMKPIRWWQCWPPRIMWFSILLTMPSGTLAGSAIHIDPYVHYYTICFMSTITLHTVIIYIYLFVYLFINLIQNYIKQTLCIFHIIWKCSYVHYQ